MNWSKTGFVFTICAVIAACSSGPTEEEIAVQVEDFRQRSAQYFNAGSFGQAYQQARLGLELTPADDGELNLLAGHALMMMRNLRDVAKSEKYLLRAQEALETYRADLVLGEYHLRYGAMLNAHARRQLKLAKELSTLDEDQLQEEVETNEERIEVAEQHFRDATQLFLTALEQSPNDLHALQLIGQSCAYLNDHATAHTSRTCHRDFYGIASVQKPYPCDRHQNKPATRNSPPRRNAEGHQRRSLYSHFISRS